MLRGQGEVIPPSLLKRLKLAVTAGAPPAITIYIPTSSMGLTHTEWICPYTDLIGGYTPFSDDLGEANKLRR